MTVKFMSLASGSSGNCYYLATDNTAILVDAGIGIRTIKKVFKERMLNLEGIQAVLVTHDHADHIKAVGHLGEKHGIPVYTSSFLSFRLIRRFRLQQAAVPVNL